jgi:CRP-like cAMP-binding protein
LAIFGPGTLLGEEDLLAKRAHTTTVRCHSMTGKLFRIQVEQFDMLLRN